MKRYRDLDNLGKTKVIYCGELLIFGIIFLLFGFLKVFGVWQRNSDWYPYFFTIVTILGGTWFIVDLIWAMVSKKRRNKISMLDKILTIPSSLATIILNIYNLAFVGFKNIDLRFLNFYVGVLFLYFSVVYIFMGIYHYFKPNNPILRTAEQLDAAEKEELEKALNAPKPEENSEENPKDESNKEEAE